jgi:hypothetical protein
MVKVDGVKDYFDFFESWLARDGSLSTYEDFQ